MRKSLVFVAIVALLAVGYGLRRASVTAQGAFSPFMAGQTVRLTVDGFPTGVTTIICRVEGMTENGFLRCAGVGDRRLPRVVNLRYVQEITPAPER